MSIIKYLIVVAFAQMLKLYWMEISIIAAVIVAGIVIQHLLKLKEEKEERMEQDADNDNRQYDDAVDTIYDTARESAEQTHKQIDNSMKQEQNQPDTLGLMFRTLSNFGCQPTKNEDGTLSVSYQGENFHMEFGGRYVKIWDPMWAGIKVDDPNMSKIRDAVNAANFNFGPTVVMSALEDDDIIGFHSHRDIMLHPACPDNEPFVKAVLDSFFKAKELVRSNFQKINTQQMEGRRNRCPIGFTTGFTNSENAKDNTSTES